MMVPMRNYCECGDYCEWCHPELCVPQFRLCAYHRDSLTWDACSDDFDGCEVEKARAAQLPEVA